jgi:transposase InsO family protein
MALTDRGKVEGWPDMMMAEALSISPGSLARWQQRRELRCSNKLRGRPLVVTDEARLKIRECYASHYCQWGPRVLAAWCRSEKLGNWSAGTISRVIDDLREVEEVAPPPVRYEITASNVMWSEDGTGFRQGGRKQELLVVQDEHSRLKLNWDLASGPATAKEVYDYLDQAFTKYGAPLVLKHDGDGIFHTPEIAKLLEKYGVLDLTSPAYHPGYNGKQERSMRDIKSYERALRKHGAGGSLKERICVTMKDLNEDRPRPVLGGRTAQVVYGEGLAPLIDRRTFKNTVELKEEALLSEAATRNEKRAARRMAVEEALLRYGLMEIEGNVSHDFLLEVRTN